MLKIIHTNCLAYVVEQMLRNVSAFFFGCAYCVGHLSEIEFNVVNAVTLLLSVICYTIFSVLTRFNWSVEFTAYNEHRCTVLLVTGVWICCTGKVNNAV